MQHTEALEPDEWRSCFEALPAAERSRHRSDLVLSGLGAGLTLQELGDLFGVSRERIRQIAKERGVSTKKLREEQRERTPRKPASTLEVGSSLSGTDWMMVFTVGSSMVLPSRSTVSVAAPSRFARIRSVSSPLYRSLEYCILSI